jgi:hypothetical protein
MLAALAEKDRATAALIGMEYAATNFDSASLLRAVEISESTVWRWPLGRGLGVMGMTGVGMKRGVRRGTLSS